MKLSTKFLCLLVPLVVGPLLFVGKIAYTKQRASAEVRTFDQVATSLSRQQQTFRSKLQVASANVELFSSSKLIQKYVLTDDEQQRYGLLQKPLLRVLKDYQAAYPEYYEIRILLPDGYEDVRWVNSDADNVTEEEASSPFFRAMVESPEDIYTSVIRNPDNQAISLLVSKRLVLRDSALDPINAKPKLRGYLVLTVNLDGLERNVLDQVIGDSGFYVATASDGTVLFQPEGRSLDRLLPHVDLGTLVDVATSGSRLETRHHDSDIYVEGVQLHRDLYLFALLPKEELLQSSRALGNAVALVTLIAILITIAALYGALHYIVLRPVRILGQATHMIGRGNAAVSIDTRSGDEIGDLAKSFQEMSKNVQESNAHVQFLAYHDSLTGLPNRPMFRDFLSRAIAQANRTDEKLGVLFLDLDNFKRINDTLGHQVGDTLLQAFAELLSKELRHEDFLGVSKENEPQQIVARLGGDEFIILLRNLRDEYAPTLVAKRICDQLNQPFMVSGHELYMSTSIGISVYPADAVEPDDLIKNADAAMYHAKDQGRNNYQYYAEELNIASTQRLMMESKLRKALELDHFELHYQPQVDGQTLEITGAEALIRWRDPDIGMVRPDVFIPLAEETGLIVPIGEWVLNQACIQTKAWQDAGLPNFRIAVNVSSVQVARQDLGFIVSRTLKNSRLDSEFLEIELTESALMTSEDRGVKALEEIRALGVGVALDDFGTGYSSLSYLRKFPISNLKIDRSFIMELSEGEGNTSIVAAIIAMAHSLGLEVTAEGVEDESQLRFLQEQRCNHIQGYYFSRPLPAAEFELLLQQRCLKTA